VFDAASSQRCPSKLLVSLHALCGNMREATRFKKLSLQRITGHKIAKPQPQKKAKRELRSGPILRERQITLLVKSHFKETGDFLIVFSS